ncbi:uncharacterized protein PHALS_14850 [Plasmopara halstedii]|uniref:Uncharacterized protein n=1 Tax=Plasmopara halstedii TaxID=4781 RepID=A0A0P1AW17_PLAHL|nr:uncharacterized protein PHALS_14850 [Plasmopara halstedii]CEG45911.1 hypothetical protein PHALS_14850 [Plasmopara halstedii]|eukprot:XP_024582280.1 hypothetical protein PHALS_14850 [Plasmopara halstedii]
MIKVVLKTILSNGRIHFDLMIRMASLVLQITLTWIIKIIAFKHLSDNFEACSSRALKAFRVAVGAQLCSLRMSIVDFDLFH